MAQITITINGYSYTVGCDDGQEHHLQAMAKVVEEHIDMIRQIGGQSGEGRLLALAGLLMADKLHDIEKYITALEKKNRNQHNEALAQLEKENLELQQKLELFAKRAETIAETLKLS